MKVLGNLKQDFLTAFNEPDKKENFNVILFRAIMKADIYNIEILASAYPEHYKIFDSWKRFGVDHSQDEIVLERVLKTPLT